LTSVARGLTNNGLMMPPDFPTDAYERVLKSISRLSTTHNPLYVEFASAWNALAYRFLGMAERGDAFTTSIIVHGTSPVV
jgi:hypothetical protein